MIHNYTTLPPTDISKVRATDCITASKSVSLDVRVLKVAELISNIATVAGAGYPPTAVSLRETAETLRNVAAEIRDAATPPSSRTLCGLLSNNAPLPDQLRTASEQLRGMLMAGELDALPEDTKLVFGAMAMFLNGAAARVGGA
jgi:hypothetical protein